jgi:type I restriction enzyme S subunit
LRTERLKHVADVRVSNVDKKTVDGEVPVKLCNYTDVYYNERITAALDFMDATATADQRKTFGLRPGDVVLTKDSETADDIGVSALVVDDIPDLVCGYHLAVVRPRPEVAYGPYVRWVLAGNTARQAMTTDATGVTRFGLRSEAIADLEVPLPPLEEQRAIADYLDRETDRIDRLMAIRHAQLRRMQERLASIFQEEIDSTAATIVPLRRLVCQFVDYRGATPEKSDTGVPLVTATNVSNGKIDFSLGEQFVSEETYRMWMRRGFPKQGDVLLTTEAPLGQVAAIVDTKVALAQRLILLKPDRKRVSPEYLRLSLMSPRVQADLLSRASGSTVWGIRADRLREVCLAVPDPTRTPNAEWLRRWLRQRMLTPPHGRSSTVSYSSSRSVVKP